MNDLTTDLLRTRVRIPPPPPYYKGKDGMFEWLFKKDKKLKSVSTMKEEFEDTIEESLWEIKEQFDLETEEVERTVLDKRENVEYMRKTLNRKL